MMLARADWKTAMKEAFKEPRFKARRKITDKACREAVEEEKRHQKELERAAKEADRKRKAAEKKAEQDRLRAEREAKRAEQRAEKARAAAEKRAANGGRKRRPRYRSPSPSEDEAPSDEGDYLQGESTEPPAHPAPVPLPKPRPRPRPILRAAENDAQTVNNEVQVTQVQARVRTRSEKATTKDLMAEMGPVRNTRRKRIVEPMSCAQKEWGETTQRDRKSVV